MKNIFNINAMKDSLEPLYTLRLEQDAIDKEIIQAIAKRLELRRQITAFRSQHELPTIDPDRMETVLKQAEKFAEECNMPPEMGRQIFNVLIDWSHRLDRQWRNEQNDAD